MEARDRGGWAGSTVVTARSATEPLDQMMATTGLNKQTATRQPNNADALKRISEGEIVIISDGESAMAVASAARVSAGLIARFEKMTSAPFYVALSASQFDGLGLVLHSETATLPIGRPVDVLPHPLAAMSRSGRADTVAAMAKGLPSPVLRVPGHVTPLRAMPGGLLARVGHIEGAVDLVSMAGEAPAAIVAFLVSDDGAPSTYAGAEFGELLTLENLRSMRLLRERGNPHHQVASLFIEAMTRNPAAVAVITACAPDGAPAGLLVSSMSSYSGNPPSVVFSVSMKSRTLGTLLEQDDFGVNILAREQEDVAAAFAGRGDKFRSTMWIWDHHVPRIEGTQSFLRCRKTAQVSLGDHTLFVGAIISGESSPVPPLIYFDRSFQWTLTAPSNPETEVDASDQRGSAL